MHRSTLCGALLCATMLLGAAPRHILTADYWGGYAGTRNVPAASAAQWLSWAETDPNGAQQLAPLGVKTLLYSDPNRLMPGDSMYATDESQYAHDCSGQRIHGDVHYPTMVLTDPHSQALAHSWNYYVRARMSMAHFDAVFNDEAVGMAGAADPACGYTWDSWMRAENALQKSIGVPVIYNGLRDFYHHGVAREIDLNATAAGGMMEECYGLMAHEPRAGGWMWSATEDTELRMAHDGKYFFCYGRDLTPADQAYSGRLYTYASFLLTYDPRTSILWEYYKTPSGGHVMPESALVAWDPVTRSVATIDALRNDAGVYMREYRHCFLAGRPVGPCIAAVNPDSVAHPLWLRGFSRTLALQGSGVFDGGRAYIVNTPPAATIAPLQGVIAFR